MKERQDGRTEETAKRDAQKNAPQKNAAHGEDAPKTVTCKHCRYEYLARLDHCSICGYPWPWLKRD